MKKLMIAAAVAAGFAAFGDGLESANTVGYENTAMRAGSSLYTPMFAEVGAAQMNIQDLIPTGDNVPEDGSIVLQTLSSTGGQGDVFLSWWGDGWYDENDDTPDTYLNTGDAAWIAFPDNTVSLTCSGEVKNQEVVSPLVNGSVAIGNPYPVQIDIQDIVPVASEGDVPESGEIVIQTLSATGGQGDVFLSWWGDGWYDENDETPATLLDPGEGIWVASPAATLSLKWPGFTL